MAAAMGKSYHIPFGGRSAYQYADDVARIFIQASRADFQGADVFNLRSSVARMSEIITAIEAAEPGSKGQITFDDKPLPFPEDMDDSSLVSALGTLPYTPLNEGVAQTVNIFKQALKDGRLTSDSLK